jgi:hypothetical protein
MESEPEDYYPNGSGANSSGDGVGVDGAGGGGDEEFDPEAGGLYSCPNPYLLFFTPYQCFGSALTSCGSGSSFLGECGSRSSFQHKCGSGFRRPIECGSGSETLLPTPLPSFL